MQYYYIINTNVSADKQVNTCKLNNIETSIGNFIVDNIINKYNLSEIDV